MFCNSCGNKLQDNTAFCTTCGAKIYNLIQQPTGMSVQGTQFNTAQTSGFSNALTLCTALCFLRLIYAIVWVIIVLQQMPYSFGAWLIIWNIVWTIVSCVMAAQLFFARFNDPFNAGLLNGRVLRNRDLSLFGVLWYGGQWFLFQYQGYYVFFTHRLVVVIEIAIVAISIIALTLFGASKASNKPSFESG